MSVNNSTNINKTKESLNSERQQFHQYQQNKRKFKQWASTIPPISTKQKKVWTVSVNNSTNINKTKENLNSERQQFHQYQQNKRKFEQWASTIPPISTKQKKVWTVSVNNSTNINKTNNHLSLQIIEHKKKTMTCDAGNPGPGLRQAQKVLILCSKNQYKLYLIQSNMFKWQPLLSYSQTCSSDNLY